jgi:integrase-like protein
MNTDQAVRRLTEVLRRKHLALATERSYCAWLRRYCDYLKTIPFHFPSQQKLERFLTALAKKDVAASTQNQAFNAIIHRGIIHLQASHHVASFHRGGWQMPQPWQRTMALPLTFTAPPGADFSRSTVEAFRRSGLALQIAVIYCFGAWFC